jgi:hypothetical protein
MNHDSLAQIPVNSVLIGLFTEALNTITTPGTKYPEYITINGGPATNTTSRTYKFKSADVRKYLEGLKHMIETTLTNFIPEAHELTTGAASLASDKSPVLASNKYESEAENEVGSESENETTENVPVSEKDNTVAILDEEPSSSETGETQEPSELGDEKPTEKANNTMKGGAKRPKTRSIRNKKISLKTLKRWN